MLLRLGARQLLRAVCQSQLLWPERFQRQADPSAIMRMPVMVSAAERPEVDWTAFYAALHRFVAARVRNATDVDDLVHLILERAMSKSAEAEIHSAPGWLFGIARNAVADHFRAQARTLMSDADALEAAAPLGDADEERAGVIACMAPLLATLPDDSARLLRWADMEGQTMQAIADDLGITLTAAKSRVQRARKELVKATRDCCAITVDARGRVTNLTPKNHPPALECDPTGSCRPTDFRKSS